ncbi:hypothetical protein FKM82_030449 [Ascaphus truei]
MHLFSGDVAGTISAALGKKITPIFCKIKIFLKLLSWAEAFHFRAGHFESRSEKFYTTIERERRRIFQIHIFFTSDRSPPARRPTHRSVKPSSANGAKCGRPRWQRKG